METKFEAIEFAVGGNRHCASTGPVIKRVRVVARNKKHNKNPTVEIIIGKEAVDAMRWIKGDQLQLVMNGDRFGLTRVATKTPMSGCLSSQHKRANAWVWKKTVPAWVLHKLLQDGARDFYDWKAESNGVLVIGEFVSNRGS